MNRRIIFGVLLALLLLAGAVAIGATAYRAGVAQGLADSGKLVLPGGEGFAPEGGAPAFAYPYYGFHHRPFGFGPFGFGFGFLQCLFPLIFFFLFFSLLRGLFGWRRPWGWGGHHGGHGPWNKGAPPMFEEWHKRAHGEQPTPPQEPPQS
ncbi:MAG: hypothetical protein HYZ49_19605 [Chloroflexi bacterium]|nr:hypothetical protein [Chloroflexota bacterium]